jgi:hypothetical protein
MFAWHVISFLCILPNDHQKVSSQAQMDSSNTYRNLKIEPNDIGHVENFGDAQVLTYLQISELDVGITSKEKDQVLQRAKNYTWEKKTPSHDMAR